MVFIYKQLIFSPTTKDAYIRISYCTKQDFQTKI